MGLYEIEAIFENGTVKIKTIDDHSTSFIVNSRRLCLYHKPTSRKEFSHQIQQHSDMEWIGGTLPFESLT